MTSMSKHSISTVSRIQDLIEDKEQITLSEIYDEIQKTTSEDKGKVKRRIRGAVYSMTRRDLLKKMGDGVYQNPNYISKKT